MIRCDTLYRNGRHAWLAFGQDPSLPANIVETNQYLVRSGDQAVLLDPGGTEIFPAMLGALSEQVAIEEVRHIVLSHQDPDIGSSLPLWREVCRSDLKVHVSWLWTDFLSHFDAEANLSPLPDRGAEIALGELSLRLLPAHFLHSPGNFHVYDATARILFSADVGASLVKHGQRGGLFVEDFAAHVQFMDLWHRRAMGSERARDAWIAQVSRLDIAILAPQHGPLLRGDDVKRFLDWFAALPLGTGIEAMSEA